MSILPCLGSEFSLDSDDEPDLNVQQSQAHTWTDGSLPLARKKSTSGRNLIEIIPKTACYVVTHSLRLVDG